GQNVRWSFSGTIGERFGLGKSNSNVACCVAVTLHDANGAQIGSNTYWSGTSTSDWNVPALPATGSYTIVVDLTGQTNMALTLTLSDDILISGSNGPPQALQPRSGQNVRWSFYGTSGERLGFGKSNSNVACCVGVTLLDANGAQIGSTASWSGNSTNDWNL